MRKQQIFRSVEHAEFCAIKSEFLRGITFCFHLKKTIAETTGKEWLRLKRGDFDTSDKECLDQPEKFEDAELLALKIRVKHFKSWENH